MIMKVMAFKHKLAKCYTVPHFAYEKENNDIATELTRIILMDNTDKVVENYKNKALYCVGTFDDITGVLVPCEPELILDCDDVLAEVGKYGQK